MYDYKNIKKPRNFQKTLTKVMDGIYELLELSKEQNLESVGDDGETRYLDDAGKTCFQVSGQFDRPHEYLQSLLDIIRVNYEPYALGTFFLNSNMDFLYEAIPSSPFQLGYVSINSDSDKKFDLFWKEDVIPYIKECGYDINDLCSVYAVVTTGEKRYDLKLVEDVSATLNSGFSLDEVMELFVAQLRDTVWQSPKQTYSGFCLDKTLGTKIRLSLWIFLNGHGPVIQ